MLRECNKDCLLFSEIYEVRHPEAKNKAFKGLLEDFKKLIM